MKKQSTHTTDSRELQKLERNVIKLLKRRKEAQLNAPQIPISFKGILKSTTITKQEIAQAKT